VDLFGREHMLADPLDHWIKQPGRLSRPNRIVSSGRAPVQSGG
jgi:hypothetical protein